MTDEEDMDSSLSPAVSCSTEDTIRLNGLFRRRSKKKIKKKKKWLHNKIIKTWMNFHHYENQALMVLSQITVKESE